MTAPIASGWSESPGGPVVLGGPKPDVVKLLQRQANWVSCRALHCCSVDPGLLKVRLSPGSDRIADDAADSGLCHRRTLGFSSQLVRASGFWSARRSIPEYRKFVDHELESIGAAPRKA